MITEERKRTKESLRQERKNCKEQTINKKYCRKTERLTKV
jgi:hypothetical protein